MKEGSWLWFRY